MGGNWNGPGDGETGRTAAPRAQRVENLKAARAARSSGPRKGKREARARWREKVERAVRWAATHETGTKTKNALAATLLELKAVNPAAFMRILLPLLPSEPGEKEEEDEGKLAIGDCLERLN